MSNLNLALVQTKLVWESHTENLARLDRALTPVDSPLDMVILPEVFGSGFSMDTGRIAQEMDGESVAWMQNTADRLDSAICGSLAIRERGQVFNRFIFATPSGQLQYYDKRHLFRMGGEHNHYAAGEKRILVEWRGWRISPMVCYDLRFPAWCRNREQFDLQIFVANWPASRAFHWRHLLIARAIENQAFVVGVNRIGADGKGVEHAGDSLVADPRGELLLDCEHRPGIHLVSLDKKVLLDYRENFPAYIDADRFSFEGEIYDC